jgi:adenosylmethionine-8-amino-7-oxononanoate aminotransferase
LDLPIVGDVRGKCFMMCVENVANKETKELLPAEAQVGNRIAAACEKRGVLVRPVAHLNVMSPPLIMTREQIDFMVDTLREGIIETQESLKQDGYWKP